MGGGRGTLSLALTCRASSGKDRTGRHNVVHPRPSFSLVGHVFKMTGRDDEMSSVLVLPQDGRTAPLRTLSQLALWASTLRDFIMYLMLCWNHSGDHMKGVLPPLSGWSWLTSCLPSSIFTTSACPHQGAYDSGVLPPLSGWSGLTSS